MSRERRGERRVPVALDYLSPLPPVRSGIADYSRDLLPHLESLCDLRVLRLSGQPVDDEIDARFHPLPAVRVGEGGRIPLYHLGNNPYHGEVFSLARERPGITLLHDVNLHHLLLSRTMRYNDLAGYRAELVADHGWIGDAVAPFIRWGLPSRAAIFALDANRSLLRRQRGILVHSSWAAAHLLETDPQLQIRQVPMGVPLPSPPSREVVARFRTSLGVDVTTPLIGAFGFQTPIKRNDRIMAALARPALRNVHLLLVGEASPQLDLEAMAREAGVADRVHKLGFVPFAQLETAIAACDLCVNLRYPTAGETSASLLRILALGRAAIVSDYAQFSDLADDVVMKVPLGDNEVDALAKALSRIVETPRDVKAMGERARAYVASHHAPERAAAAIVSAVEELGLLEANPGTEAAVRSPRSLTASRLPFSVEIVPERLPWSGGESRHVELRLRNLGNAMWLPAGSGAGGLAIAVRLVVNGRNLHEGFPWQPLLREVEPGGSYGMALNLRKPHGPAQIKISLETLGAPQDLDSWKNEWVGLLP